MNDINPTTPESSPTVRDLVTPVNLEAPEPEPTKPEEPTKPARPAIDLEAMIGGIPAMDWLKIRHELDLTAEQICEDSVAMSLVCAVRLGAQETGLYQWEKFGKMTPEQLAEFLNVEITGPEVEATKSDQTT